MYQPNRSTSRPTILERYEWFKDRETLNWLTDAAHELFLETGSEKANLLWEKLVSIKANQEVQEVRWREEELLEAFKMLKELPYSQVTYLLYYRDKDNE